ncbi:hypothetical protein [Paracoccus aerodenitrificans]|uniref:hypothetical protein n=1 Tax=Paracoccus aerodenitrificans TaxID=3017781 RepID=UPI0022F0EFD9|nr:hypothetical protein [Paracoccus aerodenitrificans]WBU65045.1 hypothetical protein PAE61_06335 [Paracoccus aerodenitrificans]
MSSKRKTDKVGPASREERLGAALRANLARRKAQARARADSQEGEATDENAPESEE